MPAVFARLFELIVSDGFKQQLSYRCALQLAGILEVFVDGLDLDATDPRDKLFALYGFGEETSDVSRLPKEIVPNYSKSVRQVFADFTHWWFIEHKSLRILSAVHASIGRVWPALAPPLSFPLADRPSWSLWHTDCLRWANTSLGLRESSLHRASGNFKLNTNLLGMKETDSESLSLEGRRIACIEQIGQFPYLRTVSGRPGFDPAIMNAHGALLDREGAVDHSSPETQSSQLSRDFEEHLASHRAHARDTNAIECHPSCHFHTKGGLHGLCPPGTQPGDMVAILHGGSVPCILRSAGQGISQQDGVNKVYFTGECYLEGCMGGEACAVNEDGSQRFATETFHLI